MLVICEECALKEGYPLAAISEAACFPGTCAHCEKRKTVVYERDLPSTPLPSPARAEEVR